MDNTLLSLVASPGRAFLTKIAIKTSFLINFNLYFLYSFKNNTSFVSRFNTLRRGRSSHNPSAHKLQAPNTSNDNLNAGSGASGNGSGVTEHPPLSREASLKKGGPGSDGEYKFF